VRNILISMLPSASMPSARIAPSVGQLASLALLPEYSTGATSNTAARVELSSARPWAAGVVAAAAGKPIAPTGASALHACVEQQMNAISEENYAFPTIGAGWLSNGSAFGTHVQTQLAVDGSQVARIDGRAGSPPRGTPV
jgi:hypothetical protein